MWPFLVGAGFPDTHDGHFHLYRLLSLRESWAGGHLYPRLFPDFAFGYGFAVLHFYGPLTYYTALVFSALLPVVAALKLTFLLSYPLAALAMWWLAREVWQQADGKPNERAGLVAAAAYTYVPYHLADVQLRGALAESWAFVWWPLVFWAVWRGRAAGFAVALAALVLTHNLSVVLMLLPLAGWAAVAVARAPAPHAHLRALLRGGTTAVAATAFYWLPVLLESRYVMISQDVGGQGFSDHLAPWREWIAPEALYRYFPNQGVLGEHPLSWAQVALLVLVAVGSLAIWRRGSRGTLLVGWLTVGGALFLLTPRSQTLWRYLIFPFGLIQYPWRWLGMVAFGTALLSGLTFRLPESRSRQAIQIGTSLIILTLGITSLRALPWTPRPIDPDRHPLQMWEEDAAAGQVGATWTAEFLPLTVSEQRWALTRVPEPLPAPAPPSPLILRSVGGDPFTLRVNIETTEASRLVFPRFAYPSMRATLNGREVPVSVEGRLGLVGVEMGPGRHEVALQAIPLARHPWLSALLWLPAAALLLLAIYRAGRGAWIATAVILLLLLLLPRGRAMTRAIEPSGFGEQVTLGGFRAPVAARAGESLPVTLLWLNRLQTDRRFNTFVHLTAEGGGPPLAQSDGEPNGGMAPTPRWLAGQLVEDLHLVSMPPDLPPGRYELWAGMYETRDGSAVPLPGDSGDRRLLTTIDTGQ